MPLKPHSDARRLARALAVALLLVATSGCTPGQVQYDASLPPLQPTPDVEATLFLVGDAGDASPAREAVLDDLGARVAEAAEGGREVLVAFLGDNIYEVGARAEHEAEDRRHLTAQMDALGRLPNVRGVFVPGNHDWAKGAGDRAGRDALALQQRWLEGPEAAGAVLAPADGCPGPATAELGGAHLVFVDTEWLLRRPQDGCGPADDFYLRLQEDLERHRDRPIVLLSHHPFASGGPHGGHVAPLERGPFVYYLAIKAGVSIQDIASGRYTSMIRSFEEAFRRAGVTPFVHAAGHDHNLQVIRLGREGSAGYQLVSGSASRTAAARRIEGTRYATDGHGYMRLEMRAGDARLTVFARDVAGGAIRPVFVCSLTLAAAEPECPEAPRRDD